MTFIANKGDATIQLDDKNFWQKALPQENTRIGRIKTLFTSVESLKVILCSYSFSLFRIFPFLLSLYPPSISYTFLIYSFPLPSFYILIDFTGSFLFITSLLFSYYFCLASTSSTSFFSKSIASYFSSSHSFYNSILTFASYYLSTLRC